MNHFIVDGRYKELLQYHGLDVGEVLKKARLPEDILSRRNITMKEPEYYRFLTAIGAVSKNPSMPLKLATTDQIESFSPPIFAAYCSRDGATCIQRLARYKKLIGPMSFVVTEDADSTTVTLAAGEDGISIPQFLAVSEFAFLLGILRKASKEHMVPVAITLPEEAPTALADFFGLPPTTGHIPAITFQKCDLEQPFISYNEAMWSYFEPEMNRRLADLDVDDSISARVRSALTELLPGGLSSIEDVAEKLGLTKRTLQRKLSEEHTTFQKQLNSTREVLAIHYINNTDMSTNDIAFLLGYAELNSFLRAFTVWTGKSITEYKAMK